MKKLTLSDQSNQVKQLCVAFSLRKLNRVISNIYNSELAAVGMTSSQMNILTMIARMQPVSPTQISKIMHLEKSSVSRNLEIMRRNGWLHVEGNSRAVQLSISKNGEKIYCEAFPHWQLAQKSVEDLLGAKTVEKIQLAVKSLPGV